MTETMSLFDLLPEEEAARFKPIKANDWKWTFADYPKEKNGLKVFSCFACGGGSTMGYKLAGCDVVGCCEIDPKMNEIYVKNHNPKYNFLMDIRDFNAIPNEELPAELFDLDVLDGIPPCTTFSTSGDRQKSWGKKKKFREGQKEQTLDDLSFIFIETAKKLQPRVVIMENVAGLLLGEAFGYVQKIYKQFEEAGYKVHHWLMESEKMGVPQRRHRVIFVAIRNDIGKDPGHLNMTFNYEKNTYKEITDGTQDIRIGKLHEIAKQNIQKDTLLADTNERINGKRTYFDHRYVDEDDVVPTVVAGHGTLWLRNGNGISKNDIISAQTFPRDYDFGSSKYLAIEYICGMSVPPVMMKRIVQRLIEQGVFAYKGVQR